MSPRHPARPRIRPIDLDELPPDLLVHLMAIGHEPRPQDTDIVPIRPLRPIARILPFPRHRRGPRPVAVTHRQES